ncbi:hypothetical protein BH11PLA2_BH11PLA2_20080 [soil metagenome]
MPSRFSIVLILIFWLMVTAYVVHREVLPRFNADAPPAVQIDLSDEATVRIPAQWGVFLGDKRLGTLNTQMLYDNKADVYTYVSTYNDLKITAAVFEISAPKLKLTTTVNRDGAMVAQGMKGNIIAADAKRPMLKLQASVTMDGVVIDGLMQGRCTVNADALGIKLDEPFEPVPVPAGQVLQPLQPMNRLRGVKPGHRWMIREVNPLTDAVTLLVSKMLKGNGLDSLMKQGTQKPEMIAEVRSEPVMLKLRNNEVSCWVIDYRSQEVTARTWVAVDGGKVLRQDANGMGETLMLLRED